MGGRAASVSVSEGARCDGLLLLAYPLHPPGQPSGERGKHLFDVQIPMLFMQGTRDELADLRLLQPLVERLGPRATLKLFVDADHSFHVTVRSGRKDGDVRNEMLDALAGWIAGLGGNERLLEAP